MAKKLKGLAEITPRKKKEGPNIFTESTPSNYQPPKEKVIDAKANYTFLLKGIPYELMEKFKNIIYTKKIKGDYFASQQTVGMVALKRFLDEYEGEIVERPDEVKAIERNRSKRK